MSNSEVVYLSGNYSPKHQKTLLGSWAFFTPLFIQEYNGGILKVRKSIDKNTGKSGRSDGAGNSRDTVGVHTVDDNN